MGRKFTRFVNESETIDARIVAAVNRGEANLEVARHEFGLLGTHSVEEALDQNLDFVIISSTTVAHAEQVVAAAEAGCHIFCEKPIALTLSDADRMIGAVGRAGVISTVNYIMRFNPAYLELRRLIESGELGDVLSLSHQKTRGYGLYAGGARHRAIVEPDESGGWSVHHACHDLDFLYWCLGTFSTVYGALASTSPPGMSEEVVEAIVRFDCGAVGSIADSVSILRYHFTRVIGSKASAVVQGENDATVFLRQHEGIPEGAGSAIRLEVQDRKRPGGGIDHFFECIAAGVDSPHNLASARYSLQAALALQKSAASGQPVDPALVT